MHHGAEGGLSVQGIGWFLYGVFSFVVAYCAMKIAAQQREAREKAAKRTKGR